jgi:hypothetical protein
MVRVWTRGGQRVLLGIGTFSGIEFGVPETAGDGPSSIQVPAEVPPEASYRAIVRAGLMGGRLGREVGIAPWVRLPVLYRLLHGLDEEQPTVEHLIDHYGVDLDGLLEQLATGALRCQVEGRPAPITPRHCQTLCWGADALAALREVLVAAWEARITLEIERGLDPAQAVELLDLDALHGAMGVEFEPLMFNLSTDSVQGSILVLLRAAAVVRGAFPDTPDDVRGRAPLEELLEKCARILGDCRPSVEGSSGTGTGFLDQIRATEHRLRAVRPRLRREGRPRFTVERAVASDLVRFLVKETSQELLGHAAALVSITCPALSRWREKTLTKVIEELLDDVRLDDATREALGRCRPNTLPPAGTWSADLEPARTWYIDRLGTKLYHLLGNPA